MGKLGCCSADRTRRFPEYAKYGAGDELGQYKYNGNDDNLPTGAWVQELDGNMLQTNLLYQRNLDDIKNKAESQSEKAKSAMAKITAVNDEIAEIVRKKAVLDVNITSEERLLNESRERIANDKVRLENIENEISIGYWCRTIWNPYRETYGGITL